jgi:hypothetical protein
MESNGLDIKILKVIIVILYESAKIASNAERRVYRSEPMLYIFGTKYFFHISDACK